MNPILISSPTRRSGTTLIQRLLTSAPNTIIYGETCANDIMMLTNLYTSKVSYLESSKNWRNKQLKSVLNGEVNQWIPDLMPDIDKYLEAVKSSFYSIFNHYESFAKEHDKTIWGTKLPEWNVYNLNLVKTFFPECKIIYVIRDLGDCLRSAKAINMVQGMEETKRFCMLWRQNFDFALQNFIGERVLHLQFNDLISKPVNTIKILEQFSGSSGTDISILKHKINTYTNDKNENGYIIPVELDKEELELVDSLKV